MLLQYPKVDDATEYWDEPPPMASPRCIFWKTKIRSGFRANYRIRKLDFEEASDFFGVYIWEYVNILNPLLHIRDVVSSKTSNKIY